MNFYSYSPTTGMEYHQTKQEAKEAAETAIRDLIYGTGPTDQKTIESITWGEVTERATVVSDFTCTLKRQDLLSYVAEHPQVIDGRMENTNGDLVRIQNIHESDLLEHDLVLSIVCICLSLSARLARFKIHTFQDITTFVELLFDRFKQSRGGTEGNMTFTTYDRKYKLVIAIQKTIALGPELQVARQKLLDAVESYPEGANDLKTIVLAILFPTDGQVRVAAVLSLRNYKIPNPLWKEGMQIIDDAIEVISSKKQIRLYQRNEQGKYEAIPLHIAAL